MREPFYGKQGNKKDVDDQEINELQLLERSKNNTRLNLKYIKLLKNEINLLHIILNRIRNSHRPTLVYRRTVHLNRLLNKYLILKTTNISLIENIQKLYVLVSSNFYLNHFIPLTLTLMGILGRIFFCVKRINFYESDINRKAEINKKEDIRKGEERKKFINRLFK
ncbi:hypothetical protein CDIK_0040 [Cucumispora dikerogammari]|nr:hypothetical protein CDIK_0040 [Cucumispora dikerogammari]